MIKDSGERREFDTGAVRDIQEGKGRCDLLPLDVVADCVGTKIFSRINEYQNTGDYKHLCNMLQVCKDTKDWENWSNMFIELSKHFEEGAKKYGEHNWQKGIPTHCYIDSAVRHYLKFLRGDNDERHDRAFIWNIVCCIWTCKHKPELNDYAEEMRDIVEDIKNAPTADVKPIVRGEWSEVGERNGMGIYQCSLCGHKTDDFVVVKGKDRCLIKPPYYCANCGAEMEGEQDE